MSVDADFSGLKQRLRTIEDLHDAQKVLVWDQATYMPPGGAEARGRQLGLLSTLAHERLVDPAISRLLDSVRPCAFSSKSFGRISWRCSERSALSRSPTIAVSPATFPKRRNALSVRRLFVPSATTSPAAETTRLHIRS